MDELFAYVEGRSVTNDLAALAEIRKKEWNGYKKVVHINALVRVFTYGTCRDYSLRNGL